MTKPFPCCGCGCVFCDEYSSDSWRAIFCGFTDGSFVFTGSSASGLSLATDMNNLGNWFWTPVVFTTVGNLRQWGITATLFAPFLGLSWAYRSDPMGSDIIYSDIKLSITGLDRCGKRWFQEARMTATVASSSGTAFNQQIWQNGQSEPAGGPNCGSILELPANIAVLWPLFGATGVLKTQLDNGTALTC